MRAGPGWEVGVFHTTPLTFAAIHGDSTKKIIPNGISPPSGTL